MRRNNYATILVYAKLILKKSSSSKRDLLKVFLRLLLSFNKKN